MGKCMHEGHRGRLVRKLKEGGVIYEHELLETLLFNACPRKDVNSEAHALIARFSSLDGVLNAPCEQLSSVNGVGENMAEYLCCIGKALKRCGNTNSFAVLKNTRQFKEFIAARPVPDREETEFCMVDKDGRVRRICAYPHGVDNGGLTDSEILKIISVYRPFGLFVCTRRTSAGCTPEPSDDELAERIHSIGLMCGVNVYDYCVVSADGEIYSYFVADRLYFGARGASYGG